MKPGFSGWWEANKDEFELVSKLDAQKIWDVAWEKGYIEGFDSPYHGDW